MRPLGIRDRLHYSLEKQICLGSTEQFSTKNTEEKLLLGNKKKVELDCFEKFQNLPIKISDLVPFSTILFGKHYEE